jgi:hypothetical protein
MSSSRKTPSEDITNKQNQGNSTQTKNLVPSLLSEILKCDVFADPKEVKRQRIGSGMQIIKMRFQNTYANYGSSETVNGHCE